MDIGPMAASVGRWSRPHALKKKHNLSQIHSQTTIFQLTFQICGANTWTGGKKPNIGILGAALTNRYPGWTKYLGRWWGFVHNNTLLWHWKDVTMRIWGTVLFFPPTHILFMNLNVFTEICSCELDGRGWSLSRMFWWPAAVTFLCTQDKLCQLPLLKQFWPRGIREYTRPIGAAMNFNYQPLPE